jgi:hypothetical protein
MKNGPSHKFSPPDHPKVNKGKIGVLLMNLGTPEATSYWPMRRYLKEFLSDRRVIEVNPALWWVILNGIILTFRPQKSGRAYEKIWNKARNESPLKTFTRGQSEKLRKALEEWPEIIVDWAMRYGQPPVTARIDALKEQGLEGHALATRNPQRAALFRSSRIHWRAGKKPDATHQGFAMEARYDFGVISWIAAGISHEGRSLSLPLHENRAPVARKNETCTGAIAGGVSIAIWPD